MSEKKNLKEGSARLLYYRERPTGNRTPKTRMVKGKPQAYFEEELERIYFNEEDIRKFSLDKHGQNVPYVDGHMTIINNYMFDYWGYILGAEAIALYAHLKRYCYGERDFCWPNLELISYKMKMSRNTVKKYLSILEDHGFVYHFNVQNADLNNTNESPLFKVRKKVPLLSQELCDQLPQVLQVDHEKYLTKLLTTCEHELDLDPSVDYSSLYDDLIEKGNVRRKTRQLSLFEMDKEAALKRRILESEQLEADKVRWQAVLSEIRKKISKPSYDNWFAKTFAIKRASVLTIYTPHEMVTDWLVERYMKTINELIREIDKSILEIQVETVEV
ncbi:Helix-turn-helix domain-containing protein [Paenibacillus sp. UNC496MF]|uniref:helix-turn-helix domain-containing protein n=1 Tax=Paenibacillus sp. UNC496MF TaxID=1502753 RepID=UPI0008DEE5AD|nr:helix-turn-helix domain-containing protein [Paenibacillus sp. UNC496MF]SFJ77544.1 Helix-turn-helix domain-containing protein [Paenibacillus sp. UNC496MF]